MTSQEREVNFESRFYAQAMSINEDNETGTQHRVLLNYCNIDHKIIDFIIDTTPLKQGIFTPGTHIPIHHPNEMNKKGTNDVSLLLAWNYKDEILENEKLFRDRGGKFLIPIPEPTII